MLKIGITGGIGSGKTTISKVFEVLSVPVYYADDAAKRLMNEDEELKQKIRKLFGEETYTNGRLNRKYLSSVVFNNEEKLALLNGIVHPATLRDAAQWMQQQNTPYAIKEAALIFESGAQENLDAIIGVYAPVALRIQRTMKRDNISREEVLSRINKQIDETIKMRLCDHVISNNEQDLVIPQVIQMHQKFLAESL